MLHFETPREECGMWRISRWPSEHLFCVTGIPCHTGWEKTELDYLYPFLLFWDYVLICFILIHFPPLTKAKVLTTGTSSSSANCCLWSPHCLCPIVLLPRALFMGEHTRTPFQNLSELHKPEHLRILFYRSICHQHNKRCIMLNSIPTMLNVKIKWQHACL